MPSRRSTPGPRLHWKIIGESEEMSLCQRHSAGTYFRNIGAEAFPEVAHTQGPLPKQQASGARQNHLQANDCQTVSGCIYTTVANVARFTCWQSMAVIYTGHYCVMHVRWYVLPFQMFISSCSMPIINHAAYRSWRHQNNQLPQAACAFAAPSPFQRAAILSGTAFLTIRWIRAS